MLFVAKLARTNQYPTTGTIVVVKFCYKYNRGAHELLARRLLAPKLHYCGHVEDKGLDVIVMDYIQEFDTGYKYSDSQSKALQKAESLLRDNGWAFGKLRRSNVLIRVIKNDGKVCLVGFEQCGKAGDTSHQTKVDLLESTKALLQAEMKY